MDLKLVPSGSSLNVIAMEANKTFGQLFVYIFYQLLVYIVSS